MLSSTMTEPFYIPATKLQGFQFLHTLPNLDFVFLVFFFSMSVKWYHGFICSSLMICDIEHLFMCLSTIRVSSLRKNLFKSLSILLSGYLNLLISLESHNHVR